MEALLEKTMNHRAAIKVICDEFCISQIILHGRSRKADLVDVRRITAHIMQFKFGLRGRAIARVLQRDRSMVSHYLSGFDLRLQTDIALRVKYERALRAIGDTWRADAAEPMPCLRVDGWSYIGGVSTLDGPTEVMAAKSEDGIGIMARWTLQPNGTWDVKIWDTEMPFDGLQSEDGGSVLTEPPAFHNL
jgi:hypothetical protein